MRDLILSILENRTLMWGIMAIVVFGLSQAIKIPIKILTAKIKDETRKKRVNAVILLIPFMLSFTFLALYDCLYLKIKLDISEAVKLASTSVTIYAIFEQLVLKLKNKVDDITSDGKVTEQELTETIDIIKTGVEDIKNTVKSTAPVKGLTSKEIKEIKEAINK